MTKPYYRIFNRLTKKYVRHTDNGFLIFEYPIQGENWIKRQLKGSYIYKVVEYKVKE